MAFPRMGAAMVVLLLIGVISIVAIGAVMMVGPVLAHGTSVQHMNGKILEITGPDRDFILLTSDGQQHHFECRTTCRASAGHLGRHMIEKAGTDVYYKMGPDNTLQVIDVD